MQGDTAIWSTGDELLASAVDWLGHIDYLLRAAHFKGSAEPPKPVLRPGGDDGGDGTIWMDDPDQVEAYLATQDS